MKREEIAQKIRDSFAFLSSEFGVAKLGFFGSITRDEMTPESDLDIIVEFERPIGFKFYRLVEYLEQLLGLKVDVLTREGIRNIRSSEVAENIERELVYV